MKEQFKFEEGVTVRLTDEYIKSRHPNTANALYGKTATVIRSSIFSHSVKITWHHRKEGNVDSYHESFLEVPPSPTASNR